MIESQTIAGPVALARAFALPPSADRPGSVPDVPPAIDRAAPYGPRPTFKVTFLERVWEDRRWPGPAARPGPGMAEAALARNGTGTVDLRA